MNGSVRGTTYLETDLNTMVTTDIAVNKLRKKATPKATIKRSYSEREIRVGEIIWKKSWRIAMKTVQQ